MILRALLAVCAFASAQQSVELAPCSPEPIPGSPLQWITGYLDEDRHFNITYEAKENLNTSSMKVLFAAQPPPPAQTICNHSSGLDCPTVPGIYYYQGEVPLNCFPPTHFDAIVVDEKTSPWLCFTGTTIACPP